MASRPSTTFLSAAIGCLLSLSTLDGRVASAEERATAPVDTARATDDAAARRLAAYLVESAARARDARVAIVTTSLVAGAASVPAGLVLSTRSDPVAQSIGVGMTASGAVPLVFSALSLRPSRMEKLNDSFMLRRASGMGSAELVRETEDEWRASAKAGHDQRIVIGIVALALGAACTVVGLSLLLAQPGVGGLDRNDQYTVGSSLVGPGVPFLALGIRALLQETPEESSWATYRIMGDAAPSAPASRLVPSVGLSPVRGGEVVLATLSF